MFHDYSSFLYYRPSMDPNDYALPGDKSRSNIYGCGTTIFNMKGLYIIVRNALHVPSLRAPLSSTQRHQNQLGCTYYDYDTVGNLLLFPTMVIDMDLTTDNIVSFHPIRHTLQNCKLNYAEPLLIPSQLHKKSPSPAPLASYPPNYPKPSPLTAPTKVDSVSPYDISNMHLHNMPDVYPCNTASSLDTRHAFDPLNLHRIFG